ncbi:Uncharacterised protein [Bordetella pertussis]|nr:Uncharacterised protein [Bordetella pertussis]
MRVSRARRAWLSTSSGLNGSSMKYGLYGSMRRRYSIACTVSTQPLLQSSISSTSSPMASRAARTRDSSPCGDQRPVFILTALNPSST